MRQNFLLFLVVIFLSGCMDESGTQNLYELEDASNPVPVLMQKTFSIDENSSVYTEVGNILLPSKSNLDVSCMEYNEASDMFSINREGTIYLGPSYGGGKCDPWVLLTNNAAFSARTAHQVVVFKNKLYIIGGYDENWYARNDVWSSSDGVTWVEETANAAFSARHGHQVVVFKDKLYLIGGTGSYDKNDVWSSSDGVTWVEETVNAAFSARNEHQVVVFNNKLYLIGGYYENFNLKNDVWSSSDGATWIEETANAAFSARARHQVVVFNNELYLIGGTSNSDVWSSSDGITWVEETKNAAFSGRYTDPYQVVVFNNKLYLIDGTNNNDVWSSSNGTTWVEETTNPAFSISYEHQVVVFNNEMYLIGGSYDGGKKNDVWSTASYSPNGYTLDYETTPSYSLTAKAYNAAGVSNEVTITINVNDIDIPGE